ncbi:MULTISPECIES: LrgB family protein [unclassified Haematobacter]|uniref:LrgB family protein n=1 Tax=unclassified Haematobacter TaxID=2640585 RepID=UPI0025B8F7E6|nr:MULTISPECIES: LrgB family protein [unclassified Haematobacter]
MTDFAEIWSYLSHAPLLWLTLTLGAYVIADVAFRASGRKPFVNPVLLSVIMIGGLLLATGTPYPVYFEGAQYVHFLLGPATVCLALPLYDNLPNLRTALIPLVAALVVGSLTAMGSVLVIAHLLGASHETLLSLVPKSVTAPVAIGITEKIGGSPTLAAALVLLTGITGAIVVTPLLNALGVRDWRARGFAVGVAAHGVGTARAFQVNETAGAFAGIGMGLNAVLTSLIAPWIARVFLN